MEVQHKYAKGFYFRLMKGFLFGFVIGVFAATVGFNGISRMLDSGVRSLQNFAASTQSK